MDNPNQEAFDQAHDAHGATIGLDATSLTEHLRRGIFERIAVVEIAGRAQPSALADIVGELIAC